MRSDRLQDSQGAPQGRNLWRRVAEPHQQAERLPGLLAALSSNSNRPRRSPKPTSHRLTWRRPT